MPAVFGHLFAIIKRHPVMVGCLLLAAAAGISWPNRPSSRARSSDGLTAEQQWAMYLRFRR
jgi:hypothetical protein